MKEKRRPRAPMWTFVVLFAVLLLLYLPIGVMVLTSFIVDSEESWEWGLYWYRIIFKERELIEALGRSFFVGISSSLLATVLGATAALALKRTRFRFGQPLTGLSYLSLVIPELVFALALLSWFYLLNIPLSLMTVIFSHVTFSLSFVLMTINGRLETLDASIDDAARDLGASEWLILRKVTMPLLIPAVASGCLLAFLLSFDDFLITFFTSGVGSDTLPIRLYVAMKTGLNPKLSALSTLMLGISFIFIFLLIKVRGLKSVKIAD